MRLLTGSVGYWPSYNVPFYPIIYKESGYPGMVNIFGSFLSYELATRAKIFRRDQGTVIDMKSMQELMRYNGMCLGQISCLMSTRWSVVKNNADSAPCLYKP